jgi:hypothetical protein
MAARLLKNPNKKFQGKDQALADAAIIDQNKSNIAEKGPKVVG